MQRSSRGTHSSVLARRTLFRGSVAAGLGGLAASAFMQSDQVEPGGRTEETSSVAPNLREAAYAGPSYLLNVRDYGAAGDGVTDDSSAFAQVVAAAYAARTTMPLSLDRDQVGSINIIVPPGNYLVKSPTALISSTMSSKVQGVTFTGYGNSISNIIFQPATAGVMAQNDFWLKVNFQYLGFYAATAGCTFLLSSTTHSAQRYMFQNCYFQGFKYALDLQGTDNNSEFFFENCHAQCIEADGAFFHVGATNTSDQFLNYWFYGCTHWLSSAPFIDVAQGGHFHIFGLDVSAWAHDLTSPQFLFNLRGSNHASGVCSFQAEGVRVEGQNSNAGLLYSEWNYGSVSFTNADFSSQAPYYTYNNLISISYLNSAGPSYTFSNCVLAGGVLVAFAINDYEFQHEILFDSCTWLQKPSPSDVVLYNTSQAGGNIRQLPPVEFRRCRGTVNTNAIDAGGAAVWDARIGYNGDLIQTLTYREVSIRDPYGVPAGSSTVCIILPVGALITSIETMSPAGAVTSTAVGWEWIIATTESTPTTVGSVAVPGPANAGWRVETTLATPFLCDTKLRATLKITATNVDQNNGAALLLIKGFW
ncbi:hypothetical protein FOS14_08285 [Skermania sp. ID1734]|nr:hypothetical protein FOS14_08285 [Skermania sp. ID1734]